DLDVRRRCGRARGRDCARRAPGAAEAGHHRRRRGATAAAARRGLPQVNGLQQATTRALRLLAPNPSPMTLDGTNTWVLREPGEQECVVVDPGPLDDAHLSRIVDHGPVALIVLTHGHVDHSE